MFLFSFSCLWRWPFAVFFSFQFQHVSASMLCMTSVLTLLLIPAFGFIYCCHKVIDYSCGGVFRAFLMCMCSFPSYSSVQYDRSMPHVPYQAWRSKVSYHRHRKLMTILSTGQEFQLMAWQSQHQHKNLKTEKHVYGLTNSYFDYH